METASNITDVWNIVNRQYLSEAFSDFYKRILSIGNNNENYIKNIYEEIIFSTDDNTEQNQNND